MKLVLDESFPFEFVSVIAGQESYRKEVNRPIYHVHKWWAQRLGSVFRAMVIGCHVETPEELKEAFYKLNDYKSVVFDPFMGSGTTLGEAYKLGCTALGRDINPVSYNAVRYSLSYHDRNSLNKAIKELERTVGKEMLHYMRCKDSKDKDATTLYYFWVKYLSCGGCQKDLELFSSYIFAQNAYVAKKPKVHVCCPSCSGVFAALYTDKSVACPTCSYEFNPHEGPVSRSTVKCSCGKETKIADAAVKSKSPLPVKMYAKLLLTQKGEKEYRAIDDYDRQVYAEAVARLGELSEYLPDLAIEPGHNTNQALNHGYNNWSQFFNDRQKVELALLLRAILVLDNVSAKEALLLLFSAVLEFNNLFTSYKGEGTGAVRHMFAHHILKPERVPLEANVWGTPKSSGSFSTLFKSRLIRALDYMEHPFELNPWDTVNKKVYGASWPMTGAVSTEWPPMEYRERTIYVSCGGSQTTGLADKSVDFVVTDPPFFDNVHYSELADFFFAWQKKLPTANATISASSTTRSENEVQDKVAQKFSNKLAAVFAESLRLLKDDGLLVFSYHHSRKEGWTSLAEAVTSAGFSFAAAHPIKSEMSSAMPKQQAKSPIDYDILLVCKKAVEDDRNLLCIDSAIEQALASYTRKINRLQTAKLPLSSNDRILVANSELLTFLSPRRDVAQLVKDFEAATIALLEQVNSAELVVA